MVDAVVMAGGDGAVIDPNCHFKGLVPIAGKPMVQWVAEALLKAEKVGEIAVVVPTAEHLGAWAEDVGTVVVSDGSFVDNVVAGVGALPGDRRVLLATGDIPAVTPDAIDDFIEQSLSTGADVVYPLVRKSDMLAQFPGSERTFVRLASGPVTGGNMMLVGPEIIMCNQDIGGKIFATRKNPVAMAHVIGMRFVMRLLLGRLTVPEVERKLGQLIGGRGAAVYTAHASIGADVDKPVDVVVAERVLDARSTNRGPESHDE